MKFQFTTKSMMRSKTRLWEAGEGNILMLRLTRLMIVVVIVAVAVLVLVLSLITNVCNNLISGSFYILDDFLCLPFNDALKFLNIEFALFTFLFSFAK